MAHPRGELASPQQFGDKILRFVFSERPPLNQTNFSAGVLPRFIVAIVAFCSPALAQSEPAFRDDKWRIELTPLLWVAGIDGSADTRFGGESSTSTGFEDVVANLDFGFMLHSEIGKGKWAILFDGIYIDVGTESKGPLGGDIDGDVRLALADVGFAYQLFDISLAGSEATPRAFIDGIVGARYIGLKVGFDSETTGRSRERSTDIVDPYVGARANFAITNKWSFALKGTIGGFGVGSDLDWTVGAFLDYRPVEWCSFLLGYHVLGLEFEDGGRLNRTDFDATFHGPVIGMTFHF